MTLSDITRQKRSLSNSARRLTDAGRKSYLFSVNKETQSTRCKYTEMQLKCLLNIIKSCFLSIKCHQHWLRIWEAGCDWSPRLQSPDRGPECKPTSGTTVWGRSGSTPWLRLEGMQLHLTERVHNTETHSAGIRLNPLRLRNSEFSFQKENNKSFYSFMAE